MKVKIYKDTERFTGAYAIIGGMNEDENTIIVEVPFLPPTDDLDRRKFYRYNIHDIQTGVNQIPVMVQNKDELGELLWEDENKTIPQMVQDTDEGGNPIFTEEPIIESITEWIFDEEDYNTWKSEQEAIVPEPMTEEKLEKLENENMASLMAITELYEMLLG